MISLRRRERGTTIVEAALSFLPFAAFLFGIIEMGRFMSVQVTLTNAAREGARVAVLPRPGESTLAPAALVQESVYVFLRSNGIRDESATITITPVPGVPAYTTVQVSVPYQLLTIPMFRALEITLSGTARMRNETSD
jgi:Flp pilus assembly protein TadG